MTATKNSETFRSSADRHWGFTFGVDGVIGIQAACKMLGGVHKATIYRRVAQGELRKGNHPSGRKSVICLRSIREYLAKMES